MEQLNYRDILQEIQQSARNVANEKEIAVILPYLERLVILRSEIIQNFDSFSVEERNNLCSLVNLFKGQIGDKTDILRVSDYVSSMGHKNET